MNGKISTGPVPAGHNPSKTGVNAHTPSKTGVGALVGLYAAPLLLLVGLAGLLGSLAESIIGTVAERRGWMGNDLLNALNTAIGGALALFLARALALPGGHP